MLIAAFGCLERFFWKTRAFLKLGTLSLERGRAARSCSDVNGRPVPLPYMVRTRGSVLLPGLILKAGLCKGGERACVCPPRGVYPSLLTPLWGLARGQCAFVPPPRAHFPQGLTCHLTHLGTSSGLPGMCSSGGWKEGSGVQSCSPHSEPSLRDQPPELSAHFIFPLNKHH